MVTMSTTVHSTTLDDMTYVEIPVHLDAWMMGDRFGWAGPIYTCRGTAYRRVKMVNSGRTIAIEAHLLEVAR